MVHSIYINDLCRILIAPRSLHYPINTWSYFTSSILFLIVLDTISSKSMFTVTDVSKFILNDPRHPLMYTDSYVTLSTRVGCLPMWIIYPCGLFIHVDYLPTWSAYPCVDSKNNEHNVQTDVALIKSLDIPNTRRSTYSEAITCQRIV